MDQESQVSPRKFPLNELPYEVLVELFQFLSFNDQMDYCLVNKVWCKLLNLPRFKRALLLDEFCQYHLNPICQRPFCEIIVADNFSNVLNTKRNNYLEIVGKWTEMISFEQKVIPNNVYFERNMLMKLPKLKQVNFYNLDQAFYFEVPPTVSKVTLKLFDPKFDKEDAMEDFGKLKKKLQHVDEVVIEWMAVWFLQVSYELLTPVLQFPKFFSFFGSYEKVKVNLKNFADITCDDVIDYVDEKRKNPVDLRLVRELKKFKNLKSLPLALSSFGRGSCFFIHDNPKFTLDSVQTITLIKARVPFDYLFNQAPKACEPTELCTRCITNLFRVCPNINSYRIRGNFTNQQALFDATIQPIRALDFDSNIKVTTLNYPSIEVLRLDSYEIDWSTVSQMPKLKKLFLDKNEMTLEQFKILVQKCPSIEHFCYLGGYKKGFVEVMKANWPALKKIYVYRKARLTGEPRYILRGLKSFAVKNDFVTEPIPTQLCPYIMDEFFYELCEI